MNNLYAELAAVVREEGLMRPSPWFYAAKSAMAIGIVAGSIALLIIAGRWWIEMASALLLAFGLGQLGLVMHCFGHGQFVQGYRLRRPMHLFLTAALGVSVDGWNKKHFAHHAFPNDREYDPDTSYDLLVFTAGEAHAKKGWRRVAVRYQAFLLPVMLLFVALRLRATSIKYSRQSQDSSQAELYLIGAHLLLFCALLLATLPLWHAIVFAAVHYAVLGFYLGAVFVPNHMGMPIVDPDAPRRGFLEEQVRASRNIRADGKIAELFISFIFGELNYQIEHHLFPKMSGNHLQRAAGIVRGFCEKNAIPYHSVNIGEAYREVFQSLNRVGRSVPMS